MTKLQAGDAEEWAQLGADVSALGDTHPELATRLSRRLGDVLITRDRAEMDAIRAEMEDAQREAEITQRDPLTTPTLRPLPSEDEQVANLEQCQPALDRITQRHTWWEPTETGGVEHAGIDEWAALDMTTRALWEIGRVFPALVIEAVEAAIEGEGM